jgi:hypothetical protein
MRSPFEYIATMAAGLFAGLQQTFDIASGHGNATELTPSQFAEFTPYIQFARAAYCDPKKITGWNCGGGSFSSLCLRWLIEMGKAACNALPGFQPNLTGGDGKDIQFCEHRHWPAFNFLDLINDASFRRILASAVLRCGSPPRNKPKTYVCRTYFQGDLNALSTLQIGR